MRAAKSYDECLRLLADRGWGDGEVAADDARLLAAEREKTWNLIGELVEDMSVFDVFLYANDYHNPVSYTHLDVYKRQVQAHDCSA